MYSSWRNLLPWLVGLPLMLGILGSGSTVLLFEVRVLAGRMTELLAAFLGLYILCAFGCVVLFGYLGSRFVLSPRLLIVSTFVTPGILAGVILAAIQGLCTNKNAQEWTDAAARVGCFFLVLAVCNLTSIWLERRFSLQDLPPEPNLNDPNERR